MKIYTPSETPRNPGHTICAIMHYKWIAQRDEQRARDKQEEIITGTFATMTLDPDIYPVARFTESRAAALPRHEMQEEEARLDAAWLHVAMIKENYIPARLCLYLA